MSDFPHFKVGDYAKCIEKPSADFHITVGKVYKVLALANWGDEIKINADGGPTDWQWILSQRFEKVVETPNEIKQMNKKITYHVGKRLDNAFGQFSTHSNLEVALDFYKRIVNDHGKTHIYGLFVSHDGGDEKVLIEQSEEPNKAPVVNGHEMKYAKDARVVEFGCAKMALGALHFALKAMNHDGFKCNRFVKKMTLCSGVEITKEQLIEIFNYVNKINGEVVDFTQF